MSEVPDPTPWPPAEDPGLFVGPPGYETAEDVAFAAELAKLDRQDHAAQGFYDAYLDAPPPWDDAALSDDGLVTGLAGSVCAADLMLLDSIDPAHLSENLVRLDYLRALDRVDAFSASLRAKAIVAVAGSSSSQAYLPPPRLRHLDLPASTAASFRPRA